MSSRWRKSKVTFHSQKSSFVPAEGLSKAGSGASAGGGVTLHKSLSSPKIQMQNCVRACVRVREKPGLDLIQRI